MPRPHLLDIVLPALLTIACLAALVAVGVVNSPLVPAGQMVIGTAAPDTGAR